VAVVAVAPRVNAARARDASLVLLTVSTGAVDAVSWMGLGKVFSAFMTGNLAFAGFRAGGAEAPSAPRVLAAIAGFAVGAALSAWIVAPTRSSDSVWPRRVTLALGISLAAQAAFLALWVAVDAQPSSRIGDLLIAVSALAMGVQTTAVFSLGVRAVFTTAATATVAVLMGDLTSWSKSSGERRRLTAVIVALLAGSAAGAFLIEHAASWAPVLPLAVSGVVVATAALVFHDPA
jgi:uncharacterized membrane protein YoaK (UPF0700 family)